MSLNKRLLLACEKGEHNLIEPLLQEGAKVNWGLYGACRGGHRDLAQMMIDRGANNWNQGLYGACEGGHRDIAEMMIDRGANNWNWGLHDACLGGHRDLAQMMIDKGADQWNWGLLGACVNGHRDLVQMMIDKGANNWNLGLQSACLGGHRDLAQMMIDKGANDWNFGLSGACRGGHSNLAQMMIDKGANNWNRVLRYFKNNVKFLAQILLRLKVKLRKEFIALIQEQVEEKILKSLVNRHCLKMPTKKETRSSMRNVVMQFTCTDVGKFTARFSV